MTAPLDFPVPEAPKLAENITHFARALRNAGLPVGSDRIMKAMEAVEIVGLSDREGFYWALRACFVSRPDHHEVFDQVFDMFWRDPRFLERMMAAMLPAIRKAREDRKAKPGSKRASEALIDAMRLPPPSQPQEEGEREVEVNATLTMSAQERLRHMDFEQMSAAELAEAKQALARLKLPIKPLVSRRRVPVTRAGTIDRRRSFRAARRTGGELHSLFRTGPGVRVPNIVALCDISGSMSQYSRIFLHFLHALVLAQRQDGARVHSFTFGTQLTNITRHLRHRDVDAALVAAGRSASDWEGGTRIGQCLDRFNRDWSRRVLSRGAVVLLITDGLECDAPDELATAMQHLQRRAHRVIWVNPLMRFDQFAPVSQGAQAILPHVDALCAGHSVSSLEDLARVLSHPVDVPVKLGVVGT